MSATKLYTPEVLGLAAGLATCPLTPDLPMQGTARSKACGSTITLGLDVDREGRIAAIGVRSHACAVGQAAAAIFVAGARGLDADAVHSAGKAIEDWLSGGAELPDWPGLGAIAAARDYPARHGAILLPWNAARALLPTGPSLR